MKILCVPILAALVAASFPAVAQTTQSSVKTVPGSGKAVQTFKTSATVVGIVPSTRTISLKRPDGKVVDIQAGDEVRNFDKIRVGDTVNVEYTQALSLDLKKGGAGAAKISESEQMERAPVGGQPAATIGNTVTVLADVVAVDTKKQLVTLRGPEGNAIELQVQNPEQLKRVKPGDQVQAVYTESMAIAVEPAAATAKK